MVLQSNTRLTRRAGRLLLVALLAAGKPAPAEQDGVAKALDSTATQWSLETAYQAMPDYYSDEISPGVTRPPGADNYLQARMVAPLAFEKLTILPRLTLRHYENGQGQSGIGNTELFALMIPKGWNRGSGRMGLGPLVTAPGDKQVARDEWGNGVAGAIVNTARNWFYGVLLTPRIG